MNINENLVVSMKYTLKDASTNEVLDTNEDKALLEFIYGRGQIIPGLESQMKDMQEGQSKEVKVLAKDAYGEYNEEAKQTLPKEQFAGINLEVGMTLFGQGEEGQTVQVIVKGFDDENVIVDFNHPLAGKDLLFAIQVVQIRQATDDELLTGVVGGGHSCGCHSHDDSCCDGAHHEQNGGCCGKHH